MIDQGARLVADDQTELRREGSDIIMSAPATIAGRNEERGRGIMAVPRVAAVPLRLIVDLLPGTDIERWPEPHLCTLLDSSVPVVALAPFEVLGAGKAPPRPPRRGRKPIMSGERRAGGKLIVVTGMSGAGRSTALKTFEDMGYEAVDNLPLSLLPNLVGATATGMPLALGVDVRTRDFAVPALVAALDRLVDEQDLDLRVVFLDCDDDRLERRYTETRRRHPLAAERPVADGIRLERERVKPLRDRADLVIDTSLLTPGDLKRVLHGHFHLAEEPGLSVFVTSFSFRQGLPRNADLVLDVRFLRNPHYVPDLKPLSGKDQPVGDYIAADPDFPALFGQLCAWLQPLMPRYEREGKSYLTIAIGCTGGRHRSVYVAERLAEWLRHDGRAVAVAHRDLGINDSPEAIMADADIGEAAVKDFA